MIITVKRSSLLLIVMILCVAGCIYGFYSHMTKETFGKGDAQMTVVVDAGHGGMDGGAVGSTGVLEKDLNLQVAKKLETIITENGGQVIMTRTEDISIHDESETTVRGQKRSDLRKRRDIAQKSNADVFISVHMNKFEQSQYRGAQIFYADDAKSKEFAASIKQAIEPISEKSAERETKKAYDTMYILKGAKIPSVIVECGFVSNPEEEKLLMSEEYQQQLAQAIYDGLCHFRDNQ